MNTVIITCTTPKRRNVMARCDCYYMAFSRPVKRIVVNRAADYTMNLWSALARLPDGWDNLIFMEDDDWYRDDWLDICERELERFCVVGQNPVRYYQPKTRTFHEFPSNVVHSSLCSTAIRRDAYELLLTCLEESGAKWLDMNFWKAVHRSDMSFVVDDYAAVVGMKGLTDKPCGYNHDQPLPMHDPMGEIARRWMGDEDAEFYIGED